MAHGQGKGMLRKVQDLLGLGEALHQRVRCRRVGLHLGHGATLCEERPLTGYGLPVKGEGGAAPQLHA